MKTIFLRDKIKWIQNIVKLRPLVTNINNNFKFCDLNFELKITENAAKVKNLIKITLI